MGVAGPPTLKRASINIGSAGLKMEQTYLSVAAGRVRRCAPKLIGAALLATAAVAGPAQAFDTPADEKSKLEACEQSMCELFVKKEATGSDVSCIVGKTWAGDKIKKGAESKSLDWSLGDARCTLALSLKRADVVKALNDPEFELKLDPQAVKCELESEDKSISTATLTLAPVLKFKAGKVDELTLGIDNIEAPTLVHGTIWTVAKLEDTFGLFHADMVSDVNEFIYEKCPARLKP